MANTIEVDVSVDNNIHQDQLWTPAQVVGEITSATSNELNSLIGQPATVSMSSTPASGTCAVQLTFKDGAAVALTHAVAGIGYMGTASNGLTSAAVTSVATLTNGEVLTIVTGRLFHFITTAAGLLGITVTGSAGTYYMTLEMPNGKLITTGAIVINS